MHTVVKYSSTRNVVTSRCIGDHNLALNNIISRNFSGINVFNVSVVEETEPKEYHTRFFMFIKAIPSGKSDNSPTGRTYNSEGSVTFKVEVEKALALSFALKQYASGKGKAYDDSFDNFTIFADMSKSQYNNGGGDKKSMIVKMGQNNKTNKSVINILFSQGDGQGKKVVAFFMTPYEAYSLGSVIEYLSFKCLDFELQGPGMIVRKPSGPPKSNNYNQTSNNFKPSQENFKPTQTDNQNVKQAAGDFGDMFGSDNPFGD